MTQAFNLSQLANKVNTSGQLDGATGLTGTITSSALSITGNSYLATSSGSVGIGTSSPNKQLQIQYGSSNSGQLQITNNSTGTTATDGVLFGYDTLNDVIINNQEATATKFYTTGAERMRIDPNGYVMINTTSVLGVARLSISYASASNRGLCISTDSTATTAQVRFENPNGGVGEILTGGSNTTYSTSSDYRLKEDIAPMTDALDTLLQLKPVTYKWKIDGSDGQGFIAHELQAVVPDCVTGEKDAIDKDGNPQYQGIDTSFLVATLTAAIQEQQTIINNLKTRIEILELK